MFFGGGQLNRLGFELSLSLFRTVFVSFQYAFINSEVNLISLVELHLTKRGRRLLTQDKTDCNN